MGLFSTKKKVYVASTVYNMAGDYAERPDFLKTIISSAMLFPQYRGNASLGELIVDELFTGPAMRQKLFQRWSEPRFPAGTPTASIVNSQSVSGIDFTPYIPVDPGSTAEVLSATAEVADFFYWAEQHILETRPEDWSGAWTSDYNSTTGEITIEYPVGPPDTITPVDFDRTAYYVYVYYTLVTPDPPNPDIREPRLWIYKVGSGETEIDEKVTILAEDTEFYPFIPLRIDNKSIRDEYYTVTEPIFEDCRKAYRKAAGVYASIDELLDNIEDNEDIDDIDYCYMVYGVPMNTQDNASRRYLYEFFKQLIAYQEWGKLDLDNWIAGGVPGPEGEIRPQPAANTIRIHSADPVTESYDMRIHWVTIDETVYSGLGKPDAEVGEVWWEIQTPSQWVSTVLDGTYDPSELDHITFYHQVDAGTYRQLDIWGLVHQNFVYGGKAVRLTASQGLLGGDDEVESSSDESGFIVPIHVPTLREISFLDATRVAGHNNLLVFNSYQVVKKKWYESGFFRIILVIAMIVITIVITIATGGLGGLAASAGILGTNLAVGTALGLTGLTAVIAGAVVNALAAMLLVFIITEAATFLFGETIGSIIGAIIGIFVVQGLTNFQVTGNLAVNWGQMMTAENLIKLTNAVAKGVQGYAQEKIAGFETELDRIKEDYENQVDEIDRRTAELLGYSGALLDPLLFIETQDTSVLRTESSKHFLARTLMTGSDIAEVSMEMLYEMPRLTLELPIDV